MYYISYGSNLNIQNMKKRCPCAFPVYKLDGIKVNKLINYRLVFNKYATLKYKKNSIVPIGLWKITKKCEKNLDIYEQFPIIYEKKYVQIYQFKAMVYIMKSKKIKNPSKKYFDEILKGYKDFDLDINYLYSSLKNKKLF
tara:strand:+ start:134 stop:553 length:420 start_codon:yes stop_codon:yes gene_type:complete